MASDATGTDELDRCEGCGDTDVPLRSIRMWDNKRELLCEHCFIDALGEDRVHCEDERLVSER